MGCGVIDARTISGKDKINFTRPKINRKIGEKVVVARAFLGLAIYFFKRRRVRHDSNETGIYALFGL